MGDHKCELIENSIRNENWDNKHSKTNAELCKGDCDNCGFLLTDKKEDNK